jgi:putative transposase
MISEIRRPRGFDCGRRGAASLPAGANLARAISNLAASYLPIQTRIRLNSCNRRCWPYARSSRTMNLPQRKRLPHDIPLFVDVSQEIFFITVCCSERKRNQLAVPPVAQALLDSILHQNARQIWQTQLFVIMPDHIHGLFAFPPTGRPLKDAIRLWKHWTATKFKIQWQRDFFEHRLRRDESRREKADYIINNPVRAGLVNDPAQWPYVWWADGAGGLQGWNG